MFRDLHVHVLAYKCFFQIQLIFLCMFFVSNIRCPSLNKLDMITGLGEDKCLSGLQTFQELTEDVGLPKMCLTNTARCTY